MSQIYAPPSSPPPMPSLLPTTSKVPYNIDLDTLACRGWVTLPIHSSSSSSSSDPIYESYKALFNASARFFALDDEVQREAMYTPPNGMAAGAQASEEGWSLVPGEKRMLTIRRASTTPLSVRSEAATVWRASGELMESVLRCIEEALGMKEGVLVRTIGSAASLPAEGEDRIATLTRMFRYDRSDNESRVVAEPHRDLGLLSLVVGHTPGLECWDPTKQGWIACEDDGIEGLKATLMVGQTLAKFTNWRFVAARHRVFVHPKLDQDISLQDSTKSKADPEILLSSPQYRFSLVYALRAHLPLRVSYKDFETPITRSFVPEVRFEDVEIREIYRAIASAHWNVNISVEKRQEQERKISERAREAEVGPKPPSPEKEKGHEPENPKETSQPMASRRKSLFCGAFSSSFKFF